MNKTPQDWAELLRTSARQGLDVAPPTSETPLAARVAFVGGFADELGHRRPVDGVFLSVLLDLIPATPTPLTGSATESDVWLAAINADAPVPIAPGNGALLPEARGISIEAWTETELCALHALWRVARVRSDLNFRARSIRAAAWHTVELDPENATHTPWAIHVFLARWFEHADADSRLHAEALLHGCCVYTGKPDRRSALVLLDAANELDQLAIA